MNIWEALATWFLGALTLLALAVLLMIPETRRAILFCAILWACVMASFIIGHILYGRLFI